MIQLMAILELTNKLRGLPLFSQADRADVQKWAYVKFPWG